MTYEIKSTVASFNRNKLDLFLTENNIPYTIYYEESANDVIGFTVLVIRFDNEEDALWYKLSGFEQKHEFRVVKQRVKANWTIRETIFDAEIHHQIIDEIAQQLSDEINKDIIHSMTRQVTPNGK